MSYLDQADLLICHTAASSSTVIQDLSKEIRVNEGHVDAADSNRADPRVKGFSDEDLCDIAIEASKYIYIWLHLNCIRGI